MNGFKILFKLEDISCYDTIREIIIPSEITFEKLHEMICILFNLNKTNHYYFDIIELDLKIQATGTLNTDKIDAKYEKVDKYLEAFDTINYHNDFWKISLQITKTSYDKQYPAIIDLKNPYNPNDNIKSIKEFSDLLSDFKNKNISKKSFSDGTSYINKKTIQIFFMQLFNYPFEITKNGIIILKKSETLDNYIS